MKIEKGQVYLFTNNHAKEAYLQIMEATDKEAIAVRVQKGAISTWDNIGESVDLFIPYDVCKRIRISEEDFESFLSKSKLIQ